jgi:hypothetical protein
MHPIFILLLMIFCHIVDDYYLQGWLASAKQKKWWEKNAPDKLYKFDYIMALACHSFSWAFMIMLPIAFATSWNLGWLFLAYPINMGIHMFVDDLKANKLKINLITDQLIHLTQIGITFLTYYLVTK